MGYPLISASLVGEKEGKMKVKLEQRWYLQDGGELVGEEKEKKWNIPVFLAGKGGGEREMVIMGEKEMEVEVEGVGEGWVMVNAGQVSFIFYLLIVFVLFFGF